jgi:nucleoside-diphosphate-sugar epimerase
LTAAANDAFGYQPAHRFPGAAANERRLAPTAAAATEAAAAASEQVPLVARLPVASRPIRTVVVFGAGGPLAAATVPLLRNRYTLRLTDVRPMAEVVATPPRRPDLPLVPLLPPPHETRQVDVTDPAQVLAACEGMDAIVNCTVVRPDPVQAFRVNCIGAYNVLRAAVAHGIRRVVHTGPQIVSLDRPGGYWWDFDVPPDAPPRPGVHLYHHTKFLGQEVCRVFAEEHDLEVPVLHFSSFVDPEKSQPGRRGLSPLSVSWDDAGHAMRRALEVAALPSPYEVLHILADLPHGKYSNAKAKRLLGWQPRDTLAHLWADQE